ncbi:fumarylacetoacetate hydrolase family protein [Embleya sp. NPDC056575]|uniref:fumarylacetoacetate hydrolase family protein n=1 Tax=unclassified Embleya TaxID=2699296 RepID=UPI0036C19523
MRFADVNARSTLVTGRATGIDPARAAGDESLVAPFGPVTIADDTVYWEAEVVVVIGRAAHRVPESEAWGHVAGITAGQDSSDRSVQTCTVNGETVRSGSTKDLVFGFPKAGVGIGRTSPRFLHDGDVLETTVDGVGTMRHEARARPLGPAAAGTATRSGTER